MLMLLRFLRYRMNVESIINQLYMYFTALHNMYLCKDILLEQAIA